MKKIIYLSTAVFLIVVLTACSKDVTSVSLNKDSLTLGVGETETLIATVLPEKAANKNVTWSSSNSFVASVMPNGLVTALSEGTATIVVTTVDGSFSASCNVTVGVIPVTGVTLNKTTLLLNKNQSEMLIADILPQNATNKAVYWTISNPSVATVINGLVTVTTNSGATTTITVTTVDGGKTAKCELKANYCQVRFKKESAGSACTLEVGDLRYTFGTGTGITSYFGMKAGNYYLWYYNSQGYGNPYGQFDFKAGRKYTYLYSAQGSLSVIDDGPM